MIRELIGEMPEIFTKEFVAELRGMVQTGVESEIAWGKYVIGNRIKGMNETLIENYIKYIGNLRLKDLGFEILYPEHTENPAKWVDQYSDPNMVKTDFFEAKSTAYAKAGALVDDL